MHRLSMYATSMPRRSSDSATPDRPAAPSPVQGMLETLVLRALETERSLHGYAIARHIERESGEALRIEEGSLYPALRRLERTDDVVAEWTIGDTGRRTRVYRLTPKGRARLRAAKSAWAATAEMIGSLLGVEPRTRRAGATA